MIINKEKEIKNYLNKKFILFYLKGLVSDLKNNKKKKLRMRTIIMLMFKREKNL